MRCFAREQGGRFKLPQDMRSAIRPATCPVSNFATNTDNGVLCNITADMQSSDIIVLPRTHDLEVDVSSSVSLRYPPLAVELNAGSDGIDRSHSCLSRLRVSSLLVSALWFAMVKAASDFQFGRLSAVLELSSIGALCKSQATARFSLEDLGLRISLGALCDTSDAVNRRWKERVPFVVG
jgi:hypothetical protein